MYYLFVFNSVPVLPDKMKQIAVPFSLVVSPFASLEPGEKEPPLAEMGPSGPIRCGRCKAYMCSFMQFVDGGRRFHCPFCKTTTEVREDYFQHLDHQGFRTDKFQRPELCLGSYEVVATRDYCRDNVFPKAPAHVFIIDVSYNNIKSGLVDLLCRNMKAVLPGGQVVQVVTTSGAQSQLISGNGQLIQSGGQVVQSSSGQVLVSSSGHLILTTQAGGGQEPQLIQTSSGQLYLKTTQGSGIVSHTGQQQAGVIVHQQPQTVMLQQQQQPVIVQQQQQQQAVTVQQGQQGKAMLIIPQEKQQQFIQPQQQQQQFAQQYTQPQQQIVQQVIQTSNGPQLVRQVVVASGNSNNAVVHPSNLPSTASTTNPQTVSSIPNDQQHSDQTQLRSNTPTPLTNGQSTPPSSSPVPCPSPPPVKIDPGRPFLCEWLNCMKSFKTPKEVERHAIQEHCPLGMDEDMPCLWARCDGMRRKRFSLMTHLQDRHCHPQVRFNTNS
jgi:hypothetical protein